MHKISIVMFFLFICNSAFAKQWSEILNDNINLFDNPDTNLVIEQYNRVFARNAPIIADPSIKSIHIIENQEELVDIYTTNKARISMLPIPLNNQPFFSPDYNSGLPSSSKIRKTIYYKLEKTLYYLDELAEFFGYEAGDISIKVFEGLRDIATQTQLFQNKLEEIKAAYPYMTDEQAEIATSKWVSPVKNNVPVHSTGAAIDIRLWNNKINDFVDLGKFGVIWGENNAAQTFSEDITDEQKLNRLYLMLAAIKAGLVNYTYEYWHFSSGDRYAMYWQEKDESQRIAHYGSV